MCKQSIRVMPRSLNGRWYIHIHYFVTLQHKYTAHFFWWSGNSHNIITYGVFLLILRQTLLPTTTCDIWQEVRLIGPRRSAGLQMAAFMHWPPGALQWRHNGHDGVSNHQPHHCLLNRLFGCRSKKTSELCVTGLCVGEFTGHRWIPCTNGQ